MVGGKSVTKHSAIRPLSVRRSSQRRISLCFVKNDIRPPSPAYFRFNGFFDSRRVPFWAHFCMGRPYRFLFMCENPKQTITKRNLLLTNDKSTTTAAGNRIMTHRLTKPSEHVAIVGPVKMEPYKYTRGRNNSKEMY